MPPFASSVFGATLWRLPTLVGVAVFQASVHPRPWTGLTSFTPARALATVKAAAKPATTTTSRLSSTTFRSSGWNKKAKRFFSSSSSDALALGVSGALRASSPLLQGWRAATTPRAVSSAGQLPYQREVAALVSGVCFPSTSALASCLRRREGAGGDAFSPPSSTEEAWAGPSRLLGGGGQGSAATQPLSPLLFIPSFFAGGRTHEKQQLVVVPRFPFTLFAEAATPTQGRFFTAGRIMAFTLPPLPYPEDALSPHISAETLKFHHGKHHAAYVNKLNELVKGTKFESMSLEDIIRQSSGGIFNNGAQAWNHTFYFNCMKPPKEGGGGEPQGPLRDAMMKKWTSYDKFKEEFSKIAAGHFGSGWAWLNYNKNKKELEIQQTHDAANPLTEPGQVPLLCCDVWEHAYYIDRRNDRGAYIKAWWEVVNWAFAQKNYEHATSS